MIVLTGVSALQYHRTPPPLKAVDLPRELACAPACQGGAGIPPDFFEPRANARPVQATLPGRLLSDLKGLTFPIHVMVEGTAQRVNTNHFSFHRLPPKLSENLLDIGGGVAVLNPAATLLSLANDHHLATILKLSMEFCGLYSIFRETPLLRAALNRLLGTGELSRESQAAYPDHIRSFWNADGSHTSMLGRMGQQIPWELSFTSAGIPGDLWKRAPILDLEQLRLFASQCGGMRGSRQLKAIARNTLAGSASPLETQWAIMLCLDRRLGGLGWPAPKLNAAVSFNAHERHLSSSSTAICDALWEDRNLDIEVLGQAYHTDTLGFKDATSRTAALSHKGIQVEEVTYDVLSDVQKFEMVAETLARRYGLPNPSETKRTRDKRERLHEELLSKSHEL